MSKLEEKVLKSELVFQGSFLRINRDRVLCPDGRERQREYILHPGASLIVPELDDGRLILERQYRHALKSVFLEFPAGKLDSGEHSEEAARRELVEETGFEARDWRKLGRIHPGIAYSNEFIDLFLARGLSQIGAKPDAGEEIEIVAMTVDEVKTAIHDGAITDVKTLCAFLFYEKHLREGW